MYFNSDRNPLASWLLLVAVCGLTFVGDSQAAFLAVYGGPEYSSSTDTGYQFPYLSQVPGTPVNNHGVAVGNASKYEAGVDKGVRALRWDNSGMVTELDNLSVNLSGASNSQANAVNDGNVAVGRATRYDGNFNRGDRAVRWDANGVIMELENLGTSPSGTTFSVAYAVNSNNVVVGGAIKYEAGVDKGQRAVRWDSSGVATELGHLGTDPAGEASAHALDVNDANTAVGNGSKYEGGVDKGSRAIRWDGSGTAATELGHLGTDPDGNTSANADSVNNSNVAVGYAGKFEAGVPVGIRAVRWDSSGVATELDNLGTDPSGLAFNSAIAINESNTAVGVADKYVGGQSKGPRGVRWEGSGTAAIELENLGTNAAGGTETAAYALNAAGIAVGYAAKHDLAGMHLGNRAVYWGLDNQIVDLNTLIDPASGWLLTSAYNISDTGWIVGLGVFDPDGIGGEEAYDRMFLIQIPEPGTLFLFVLGAAGLLARRQSRSG
jgi:hypothetical protein